MSDALPVVFLKRNEDRRIRKGHPWVFSNEIDTRRSPLEQFSPGDAVELRSDNGASVGSGYINPASLIAVRLLGRGRNVTLTRSLLERRLQQAASLRARLFEHPYYRLVYSESDALPGLVVDRYDRDLVVQVGTAGMERAIPKLIPLLKTLFVPRSIVLRNDIPSRKLEGLALGVEALHGQPPSELAVVENGLHFSVDASLGQKTGWFFDQRLNRAKLQRYAPGLRVLDVFCYAGGFAVNAAAAGAAEVWAIDASQPALDRVRHNAGLNDLQTDVRTLCGDAFKILDELVVAGEKFDLIVVDPPALIPRRKDRKAGTRAYERVNATALALLGADGLLMSASCSYHLSRKDLENAVYEAARKSARRLQFIEAGGQGPDHPVRPSMPESDYLKLVVSRAISG